MSSPRASARFSARAVRITTLLGVFAGGLIGERWAGGGRGELPTVLYGGCKAVRDTDQGPACILNADSKMVVWIGVDRCDMVRVEEDGREIARADQSVHGGCRLKFVLDSPQPTTTLAVNDARTGETLWTLKVDRSKPDFFEWTSRIKQRADADLDGVAAELDAKGIQQGNVDRLIDVTFASAIAHYRAGQSEPAIKEWLQVIEYASRAGIRSVAFESAYRIADLLQNAGLLTEAKDKLREAQLLMPKGFGRSHMQWAYTTGFVCQGEERLPEAEHWFRKVLVDAENLDDRLHMSMATVGLADTLVAQDKRKEAEELLNTFNQLLDGASECSKAGLLAAEGWAGVHLAEGESQQGHPIRIGQQSVNAIFESALNSRRKCIDNEFLANVFAGMAWTAFFEQRIDEAQDLMKAARQVPGGPNAEDKLALIDLEARLALTAGRANQAKSLFEDLSRLSQTYPNNHRQIECKVAIGNAEVLYLSGKVDQVNLAQVRGCLNPNTSGLVPLAVKSISQRAQAVGLAR